MLRDLCFFDVSDTTNKASHEDVSKSSCACKLQLSDIETLYVELHRRFGKVLPCFVSRYLPAEAIPPDIRTQVQTTRTCCVCGYKHGTRGSFINDEKRMRHPPYAFCSVTCAHIFKNRVEAGLLGVPYDTANFLPLCGVKDIRPSCHHAYDVGLMTIVPRIDGRFEVLTAKAYAYLQRTIDLPYPVDRRALQAHAAWCVLNHRIDLDGVRSFFVEEHAEAGSEREDLASLDSSIDDKSKVSPKVEVEMDEEYLSCPTQPVLCSSALTSNRNMEYFCGTVLLPMNTTRMPLFECDTGRLRCVEAGDKLPFMEEFPTLKSALENFVKLFTVPGKPSGELPVVNVKMNLGGTVFAPNGLVTGFHSLDPASPAWQSMTQGIEDATNEKKCAEVRATILMSTEAGVREVGIRIPLLVPGEDMGNDKSCQKVRIYRYRRAEMHLLRPQSNVDVHLLMTLEERQSIPASVMKALARLHKVLEERNATEKVCLDLPENCKLKKFCHVARHPLKMDAEAKNATFVEVETTYVENSQLIRTVEKRICVDGFCAAATPSVVSDMLQRLEPCDPPMSPVSQSSYSSRFFHFPFPVGRHGMPKCAVFVLAAHPAHSMSFGYRKENGLYRPECADSSRTASSAAVVERHCDTIKRAAIMMSRQLCAGLSLQQRRSTLVVSAWWLCMVHFSGCDLTSPRVSRDQLDPTLVEGIVAAAHGTSETSIVEAEALLDGIRISVSLPFEKALQPGDAVTYTREAELYSSLIVRLQTDCDLQFVVSEKEEGTLPERALSILQGVLSACLCGKPVTRLADDASTSFDVCAVRKRRVRTCVISENLTAKVFHDELLFRNGVPIPDDDVERHSTSVCVVHASLDATYSPLKMPFLPLRLRDALTEAIHVAGLVSKPMIERHPRTATHSSILALFQSCKASRRAVVEDYLAGMESPHWSPLLMLTAHHTFTFLMGTPLFEMCRRLSVAAAENARISQSTLVAAKFTNPSEIELRLTITEGEQGKPHKPHICAVENVRREIIEVGGVSGPMALAAQFESYVKVPAPPTHVREMGAAYRAAMKTLGPIELPSSSDPETGHCRPSQMEIVTRKEYSGKSGIITVVEHPVVRITWNPVTRRCESYTNSSRIGFRPTRQPKTLRDLVAFSREALDATSAYLERIHEKGSKGVFPSTALPSVASATNVAEPTVPLGSPVLSLILEAANRVPEPMRCSCYARAVEWTGKLAEVAHLRTLEDFSPHDSGLNAKLESVGMPKELIAEILMTATQDAEADVHSSPLAFLHRAVQNVEELDGAVLAQVRDPILSDSNVAISQGGDTVLLGTVNETPRASLLADGLKRHSLLRNCVDFSLPAVCCGHVVLVPLLPFQKLHGVPIYAGDMATREFRLFDCWGKNLVRCAPSTAGGHFLSLQSIHEVSQTAATPLFCRGRLMSFAPKNLKQDLIVNIPAVLRSTFHVLF